MAVAALATLAALAWVVIDVQLCNGGEVNGLFYVGQNAKLPADSTGNRTHRVRDPIGYDGEFYYLIAHDPLNQHGYLQYVDTPRYRWRRIGLPGLAHLLALGSDPWIDRMYVALQLAFTFIGSYWLAAYSQRCGWSALCGLCFLAIPAVSVSLDRMTVDLPLAALCVGLLNFASRADRLWPVYAILAAAPFFRETGVLLIIAWCGFRALRRDLRGTAAGAACAIPAVIWWLYVASHTIPDLVSFAAVPFTGLVTWTAHALASPSAVYGPRANAVFELAALVGIWLAFGLSLSVVVRSVRDLKSWGPAEWMAITFAAFASLIGYQDIWASAYGIARTLSPLLIALAAIALRDRKLLFASPLLLTVPRIALQLAAEVKVALLAH